MTESFQYSGKDNIDSLKAFPTYLRFVESVLLRFTENSTRVLDFGAGDGEYAIRLKNHGRNVMCVERDEAYVAEFKKAGIPAETDLAHVDGGFSHIYSCDVIEHIADDVSILKTLREKLSPDGKLLLYVPAFPILFSRMDEKIGHFRRYRLRKLVTTLESLGYVVESAEYVDSLGFFAALWFKWFGDSEGKIDSPAIRFYYRAVFPIARIVDALGGKYICGKNLLVIARKQ